MMGNGTGNETLIQTEFTQEMAAFISLLAVAVIGVTLAILRTTTRNMARLSQTSALHEFTETYTVPIGVVMAVLTLYVALSVSIGVTLPHLHNSVMTPYAGVSGFVLSGTMVVWINRGKKIGADRVTVGRRSMPAVFFLISFGYLFTTVACAAFGMSMMATYALDIREVTAQPESISEFLNGRMLIYDCTRLFSSGLILYAMAYVIEMISEGPLRKGRGPEEEVQKVD